MYNPLNKHLMFVVYDGIQNSVFSSMVLDPLCAMLEKKGNIEVTLIAFEPKAISPEILTKIIPAHDRLHVIILKRLPFIGKPTLWLGVAQLYKMLKKIPCHEIIARGPLAGWIVLKTLSMMAYWHPKRLRKNTDEKLPVCTIQARGLCAEEYRYSKTQGGRHLSIWDKWIYAALKKIEFEVYRNRRATDHPHTITIEAVSFALKEYLVKNFRADEVKILIATDDIISAPDKADILQWRTFSRQELQIPQDSYVYCYSGSYKPWQCADQAVHFFASQCLQEHKNFLLLLSQDQQQFEKVIEKYDIPKNRYRVIAVDPKKLLQYLAAADAGFLFRDPDVINWVSRPTKMLEYQALGLNIIHNNTVAWLCGK